MASLAQLLAAHESILVLDAASTRTHAGLLRRDGPAVWHQSAGESGQLIFELTEACLRETGMKHSDVRAFIFCAGPGSMLGVRTVAMALRTWQTLQPRPAYAYHSLVLLAHELVRTSVPRPFTVIADARRDSWHAVAVDHKGAVEPLRRVAQAALETVVAPLWQSDSFRAWSQPPQPVQNCAYDVAQIFARHAEADLFTVAQTPDAFQHEAPEYKKWSAQMHSVESLRRP